jgi:hypothetical protein
MSELELNGEFQQTADEFINFNDLLQKRDETDKYKNKNENENLDEIKKDNQRKDDFDLDHIITEDGKTKVVLDSSKQESFKYLESEENNTDNLTNKIRVKSGELVSDF